MRKDDESEEEEEEGKGDWRTGRRREFKRSV
jgi:hypothetical protein